MENDEKANKSGTSHETDLAGSCSFDLNGSGTCEKIDTPLTQARSVDVHGWTYFVQSGDRIKIGHTAKPGRRLKGLARKFEGLEVLAVVSAEIIGEFEAHELFAHLRLEGEWFRATDELLDYIDVQFQSKDWSAEPPPSTEFSEAVRSLLVLRNEHGHNTPMGYVCSNIVTILHAHEAENDDVAKGLLRESLIFQRAALARLTTNAQ